MAAETFLASKNPKKEPELLCASTSGRLRAHRSAVFFFSRCDLGEKQPFRSPGTPRTALGMKPSAPAETWGAGVASHPCGLKASASWKNSRRIAARDAATIFWLGEASVNRANVFQFESQSFHI